MAGLSVWLLWSLAVADSVPSLFNLMAGLPVWLLWSLAGDRPAASTTRSITANSN